MLRPSEGKETSVPPHNDERKPRMDLSWRDHNSIRYRRVTHLREPEARDGPDGHVAIYELQHDRAVHQKKASSTPVGVCVPVPLTPQERPWDQQPQPDDGLAHDAGRWNPTSNAPPSPLELFGDYSEIEDMPAMIPQYSWDSDGDMGAEADGESMADYLVLAGADPTAARAKV